MRYSIVQLASIGCGTPSFPEWDVMLEHNSLNRLQALDFTAAGAASTQRDTQLMPDLKQSMGDSTLHSVSVGRHAIHIDTPSRYWED